MVPEWPSLSKEHKVVEAVKDGSFYGLVRCDVRVPPELMKLFTEMTPLFGHAKLGEAHLSPHLRQFVVSSGTSSARSLKLRSSSTKKRQKMQRSFRKSLAIKFSR